ncbi:MAG TPA: M3 family metallopeptidase [Turneriella sp.]|nr:M3 family metallopeptidase [Turneriella sp.]
MQRLGRKYRDTVLSLGGSKHPLEVYREFRGRDATIEALLRHNGLTSAA